MKKKEKRMILILVVIAIVIIGILLLVRGNANKNNKPAEGNTVKEEFVQVLDDGKKLNISNKLKETKTLEGLSIGNIQVTEKDNLTVVLADVTNDTQNTTKLMAIKITMLDKEGKELGTLNGLIPELKVGESTQLNMGITADLANAYDFTIVKK